MTWNDGRRMITDIPYGRMLAIQAAAAGPYKMTGLCANCGSDQPVASFPRPFTTAIALCRRCREARTGVPDTRNTLKGTATIAAPLELPDVDFTIEGP